MTVSLAAAQRGYSVHKVPLEAPDSVRSVAVIVASVVPLAQQLFNRASIDILLLTSIHGRVNRGVIIATYC